MVVTVDVSRQCDVEARIPAGVVEGFTVAIGLPVGGESTVIPDQIDIGTGPDTVDVVDEAFESRFGSIERGVARFTEIESIVWVISHGEVS